MIKPQKVFEDKIEIVPVLETLKKLKNLISMTASHFFFPPMKKPNVSCRGLGPSASPSSCFITYVPFLQLKDCLFTSLFGSKFLQKMVICF